MGGGEMKPHWDNNEFGTESVTTWFDPSHDLLMDLFCEVENPAAIGFPLCGHVIYGNQDDDCSLCQLWDRIRTYAKNYKDSAGL